MVAETHFENPNSSIRVFVSYSDADRKYLGKRGLLGYISCLEREGFEFWSDQKLVAGDAWDTDIKDRIERSEIALVLVSQAFLNSAYCMDVEVGAFLQGRIRTGLVIFPIIVSPCDWRSYSWLANTQFEPRDGRTIETDFRERGSRERLYLHILEQLRIIGSRIRKQGNTDSDPNPVHGTSAPCDLRGDSDARYRRLQNLLDFVYLFTRVDQLESGAWGVSVAPWMTEVGKERPGFELNKEMATEGGIETTALCVQALSRVWGEGGIGDLEWARRCRNYFRERQVQETGSVGYRRQAFRDPTPLIESTYRHTSQAALALAEVGSRGPQLPQALQYVVRGLRTSGTWNASEINDNASRLDRYPAMLIGATLAALRASRRRYNGSLQNRKCIPEPGEADAALLSALALVDTDCYPFFKPYGSFNSMQLYSFVTIVGLIVDHELSDVGDRLSEGIQSLLTLTSTDGGIPFCRENTSGDFGLTACIVELLHSERLLETLEPSVRRNAIEQRRQFLVWLIDSFDKYLEQPELFAYFQSGTLSRLLNLGHCYLTTDRHQRLTELEDLAIRLRSSYSREADVTERLSLLASRIPDDNTNTRALAQLLDDKATDIMRWLH